MEDFLTVKEVARRLQYSEETVKRMLRKGTLPGHKIGKEWRISQSELLQHLAEEQARKRQNNEVD